MVVICYKVILVYNSKTFMIDFSKIINKNRDFFVKQKTSIVDQKNVDLSARNVHLVEIIEYIFWSSIFYKKTKKNGTR